MRKIVLNSGMNQFIAKPITFNQIKMILNEEGFN